ncbi:Cysteine-rich protein 1 [Camelus dromedarius]|nr:Cysteine-rich protein 1 [Camelus dromedarius]
MPKCPKCDKEVYFGSHAMEGAVCISAAERVTSLGKDWHRPCLKCEKCGKTLTSGGHAEHEGKPYCNHPCYAAMFGPKGFGRGGAESHTFK